MQRIISAGAVILAAFALHLTAAQAEAEYPWCAVISMGQGDVYWDCRYNSIEECRPNVIAGNRGFCNQNPRWSGWYAPKAEPPVKHGKHHRRRVKAD